MSLYSTTFAGMGWTRLEGPASDIGEIIKNLRSYASSYAWTTEGMHRREVIYVSPQSLAFIQSHYSWLVNGEES